jgi:hypothetical protein
MELLGDKDTTKTNGSLEIAPPEVIPTSLLEKAKPLLFRSYLPLY